MTINRIVLSIAAAGLGLTMSGNAMAIPAVTSPPDIPTNKLGLGFGEFLGTWKEGVAITSTDPDSVAMPNTNPSGNNVEAVGLAVLGQHPGLFDIDEFHWAGASDDFSIAGNLNPANTGFRLSEKFDSYSAQWAYHGFDPVLYPDGPGLDAVDLFVAVKYATYISFFRYGGVEPGDFGVLTSDFRVILNETSPGSLALLNYDELDDSYDSGTGKNTCAVLDFSDNCMPYNSGNFKNPLGVSHVTAYWPPVAVPEPAAFGLLGLGLAGIAGIVRSQRRKTA